MIRVVRSLWHGELRFVALRDHPDEPVDDRLTMATILADVAIEHGIDVRVLKGVSRTKHVAHARQQAMAEMRATGLFSLPQIGAFLGRDHSTVLHGVRAHAKRANDSGGRNRGVASQP